VKLESGQVRISIKDNGVGIPPEEKARLFSKFFRGSNVVRMQTEGNGLGLYIVKNIIDNHKGSIDLKSEEGQGTEFEIILPL
jgi:signal transduction histidine kinase